MVESAPKRVGKFTVVAEEAPSSSSKGIFPETAADQIQQKGIADSVEPFTLKTSQRRPRATRQPKAPPTVVGQIAEAPTDYKLWSQIIIGSSNTVVVTWLGADCAMERREAEMLEPPIARILSRLPAGQAQKLAVFVDPMVILIALGTWGNRIIRIQREKRGHGISDAELARASGMVAPQETSSAAAPPEYQQPVEPDIPQRVRVPVNPNGVPTAITEQMSEA